MKDDPTLVKAALERGSAAFGPIIDRYKDAVFGVAPARLKNFHDAEDVSQAAFVEAFERLGYLKDPRRLGAWLRKIAIHRSIDHLRGRGREAGAEAIEELPSAGPSPEAEMEERELRQRVMDAIGRLSKVQRETVALHYISGRSLKEIAAIQEVPLGTIKGRLHDARQRLKKDMMGMVEEVLKEEAPKEDFAERVFGLLNAYPDLANLWRPEIQAELREIGARGMAAPEWQWGTPANRATRLVAKSPPEMSRGDFVSVAGINRLRRRSAGRCPRPRRPPS